MTKKKPLKVEEIEDAPTDADIARGDETLKKMLKTKPKQHKDMVGKAKTQSAEIKKKR